MASLFPSIQTLTLPMFHDSIPHLTAPVPSLHTVIIDGSGLLNHITDPHHILVFLQHTPSLQILWFKAPDQSSWAVTGAYSIGPTDVDPTIVHIPVSLPCLKSLAVSVPGTGGNLLPLIDVPILEDLHMDGSRNDRDDCVHWVYWYLIVMFESLRNLAPHAPALRRIAMTEAYLSHETWEWLLGCSADLVTGAPPFPCLESIAVHGLLETNGEVTNALNGELIQSYASSPNPNRIHLLRFAALKSRLNFRGDAILKMADSIIHLTPEGQRFELELDCECEGITEAHLVALTSRNVHVIYHRSGGVASKKGSWWTLGRDIDPLDKHAY